MLDNVFLRYAQTCRKLNKNSAWANKKHSYCYTISCSKTQHLHTTLDHGPPRPSPWLHQPITPSPSNSHINHIIQANKHPNPHTRWTACSLFAASTGNPFVAPSRAILPLQVLMPLWIPCSTSNLNYNTNRWQIPTSGSVQTPTTTGNHFQLLGRLRLQLPSN